DEHNKVGFLEKPKGSDDYHQVLDFLRGSHIRYAITYDPIIYDSLVKQFWSTTSLRAFAEGPPAILATIDRTPYTITESLLRSQLHLDDDGGVEDLPIADIYLVGNELTTAVQLIAFLKKQISDSRRPKAMADLHLFVCLDGLLRVFMKVLTGWFVVPSGIRVVYKFLLVGMCVPYCQKIQEQSLRMIREQDEEKEDEKSGLHSIAMRPVSNIGGNGLNTKTCSVNALNNKEQQLGLCGIQNIAPQRHPTKERTVPSDIDMIQESVATVTTPADVVTTNTCNGDVSAPNTCNNRRQTEIRDRLRVPRARPNRQLQLDEQPTTSANKKITLVYGLQ
ncbi:hypothetical protein Tco_1326634, partial [Tanacetum coccineum]